MITAIDRRAAAVGPIMMIRRNGQPSVARGR